MSNESILKKIEELEKDIRKGVEIRVEANTNINMLQTQYKEKNKELKDLGINPKEEEQALKDMDEEISNLIQEIESKIPKDLIKEYTSMPTVEAKDNNETPFNYNMEDKNF